MNGIITLISVLLVYLVVSIIQKKEKVCQYKKELASAKTTDDCLSIFNKFGKHTNKTQRAFYKRMKEILLEKLAEVKSFNDFFVFSNQKMSYLIKDEFHEKALILATTTEECFFLRNYISTDHKFYLRLQEKMFKAIKQSLLLDMTLEESRNLLDIAWEVAPFSELSNQADKKVKLILEKMLENAQSTLDCIIVYENATNEFGLKDRALKKAFCLAKTTAECGLVFANSYKNCSFKEQMLDKGAELATNYADCKLIVENTSPDSPRFDLIAEKIALIFKEKKEKKN